MKPDFVSSLIGLLSYSDNAHVRLFKQTSVLPKARQIALDEALSGDYTHILMVDDDMAFPHTSLETLLSHDLDFVACNYARKGAAGCSALKLDGAYIEKGDGLEEASFVGLGLSLVKLECLKNIQKPHFEMRWLAERNDFIGEDFYFCGKLRSAGVKIHVDKTLSNHIGHIGDYSYRL